MREKVSESEKIDKTEVESICLLIGSLHLSGQLEPKFLGQVINTFKASCDGLSVSQVSKLYLAISKVIEVYVESNESAAYQNY